MCAFGFGLDADGRFDAWHDLGEELFGLLFDLRRGIGEEAEIVVFVGLGVLSVEVVGAADEVQEGDANLAVVGFLSVATGGAFGLFDQVQGGVEFDQGALKEFAADEPVALFVKVFGFLEVEAAILGEARGGERGAQQGEEPKEEGGEEEERCTWRRCGGGEAVQGAPVKRGGGVW